VLWAENLAAIESEGRRLALAAREDPSLPVPQYPGWDLADLVSHTASIHGRTTLICTELPAERISAPTLPEGKDPVDWYEENLDEMLAILTDSDPDTAVWGFGPSPTIGFWERRMVIETGVHRWDAYRALGREDRLIDRAAVSGLDEFPEMWLPHLGEVPPVRLVAEDVGRVWVYGEGEGETEVSGSASDLYLRLMSRPSAVVLPEPWAKAVDGLGPPVKR
jgi:uncharacterized protein (TIGR03083 family)